MLHCVSWHFEAGLTFAARTGARSSLPNHDFRILLRPCQSLVMQKRFVKVSVKYKESICQVVTEEDIK